MRKSRTPIGAAYTCAELARCHHIQARSAERDQALRAGFRDAKRAHLDSVFAYVIAALVESCGSKDVARAWLAEDGVSAEP